MGRGAANMGKTLKGRSRGLESDKKKTPSKGGRKDFDEIKARWHRQAGRIKVSEDCFSFHMYLNLGVPRCERIKEDF
eukprot:1393696-Amorphochlora_amoeboformis.AAC.2